MEKTLFIAARPSLANGIRKLLFERKIDGTWTDKKGDHKAVSRILVATLKMKYFRIHGDGEEESDELTMANVHLHSRTAKKGLKSSFLALQAFYNRLAEYVVRFGVRLMVGDWNMQLFGVIPEMRARGFEVTMAAWYPWSLTIQGKKEVRSDSCAIFTIGPWAGVRIVFDQAVFGMPASDRQKKDSMMMETDEAYGKKYQQPFEFREGYDKKCQGYVITSYMPKGEPLKQTCIDMTFHVQEYKVGEIWKGGKAGEGLYAIAGGSAKRSLR